MLLNCGVEEDSWESAGLQGDPTSQSEWDQSSLFTGRTDAEAEVPVLWPPDGKNWLIGKEPDAGKDWRQEEKRTTEDEMLRWHHRPDGHKFEQALGVGDGQGSLAVTKSQTWLSNWTELIPTLLFEWHWTEYQNLWASISSSVNDKATHFTYHAMLFRGSKIYRTWSFLISCKLLHRWGQHDYDYYVNINLSLIIWEVTIQHMSFHTRCFFLCPSLTVGHFISTKTNEAGKMPEAKSQKRSPWN